MKKIQTGIILAIAMTGIVVSVLASSLLMAYQRIPNSGNVKAVKVGVYGDSLCTSNVTSIDWGLLEPGVITNMTVYIKNEGTVPLALNMTTDNWSSSLAPAHITLSWNREDYVLGTDESTRVVETVLTLSISSDIVGITSFSFDIIITGNELQT